MALDTIIEITNASLYHDEQLILSDVNFSAEKGEFIYIIGKVGSGKSSLIKVITGEIELKIGEGRVAEFDLLKLKRNQIPYLRRKIGIVFQLADDVIDISSGSKESGKTPGTDVKEGVPTLVTLRVLASKDPADQELKLLLSGPIESDEVVGQVLLALRNHRALGESHAQLLEVARQAREALGPLPLCDATSALYSLCDAVIDRSN